MNIPLSSPDITQKEVKAIVKVLETPYLSLGPKLLEFEKNFAFYMGSKYAVAVNSGTSGLHLAIKSLDIKEGDEVITTPFSFIASANCILFEKAKPVFVDIREDTLNIDVNKIEEKISKKTKAILPVHVFGYPCDMKNIKKIADKHGLAVIEDACEAIGAEINHKKAGTFGKIAVFAFYPNKQMTTGEGGMIITDNDYLAKLCRSLRNQGRNEDMQWLTHSRLGFNYRLSDINCALGIGQLKRINEILAKRKKIADLYAVKLADNKEVILPAMEGDCLKRSWFVYVVRLQDNFSEPQRNLIISKLRENGIGCNCYFPPIHLQPFYISDFGFKPGDFPLTEKVAKRTLALPFFNNLRVDQIDYVVAKLNKAIKEVKK